MDLSRFHPEKYQYGTHEIFFDFDIKKHTGRIQKKFPHIRSITAYLNDNPSKIIYFTLDQVEEFEEHEEKLVLNYDRFEEYCNTISKQGTNKIQGFFTRKVRNYTEAEKKEIRLSVSEDELIEVIRNFSSEGKKHFLEKIKGIDGMEFSSEGKIRELSEEEFSQKLSEFIKNPKKLLLVSDHLPRIQIEILESHKRFLEQNLDKNETFIQNWIDGKIDNDGNNTNITDVDELKRIRKSRCLIFGLEFINHIREGVNSSKRIDVLTKLSENKNEYVIFELKSPNMEVFEIKEDENMNGGKSTEYHLSKGISRSLPQILRYKDNLNDKPAEDEDWQKMGIIKGKVSKCIILIGTKKDNEPLWKNHFLSLKNSLSSSVEIITYSDLIDKIETTIRNLKVNLN